MGGSSGGGGRTPYEAPESGRSKQLVKIVEVISEGEIQGFGATNGGFAEGDGEKSIYFDNTPVRNQDNSHNFNNVQWQGRTGSQNQALLAGFDTSEKEVSVSTEVKKTTPITRTITDPKVNRVRLTLGVSSLFHQNDNGDTLGTNVDFKITVGSRVLNLSINGKYSSQYLKNLVIDNLPRTPFTIKVERVQADSTSQRLQNKTLWASYTEIIDHQFTYPNTALIGIKFDSEYFSNIPTRTYDVLGIRVKVPSNYNPTTRQYSGLWDGSFKIAWTDNPAWILYDIVTNKRYGLGKRLGDFGADKWALYQVAQYCDQLVPDGFGNREPRFTCNVWLTEQRSAYDVINDICSIFRAMPVWNGTTLTVIQDRPADPVWTYTAANVIGGFSRQYSAMKARHNAVQVEYKDKENNYETAIEYVSDDEAIRKYGLNLKKVQAFGCTSRGQAYRTGRWILETERLETETITFTVGAEGLMHLPGDIIKVADSYYAGTEIGGRVLAVSGRNVTLDREIQINGNSYLSFINANAQHSNIKISAVRGKVVTLDSTPTGLETLGVWSLTTQNISAKLYRAMSVAENEDGSYTITALQHEPQKEAIVDNGATFEPRATTLHQAPKIEHLDVAVSAGNAGISWQAGAGSAIVSYDVKILKNGKLYDLRKGMKTTELDLSELPDGNYQLVIQSRNASGQIIDEKSKTFTIDRPPVPSNVQVTGGLTDVILSWDIVNEATQTEIWASERNDLRTAKRVAKVTAHIYTHTVGSRQVRFYWLRHTRGQNLGTWYQTQGVRAETGANIDAELEVLNEKLKAPLAREVIETALPARNLGLLKSVRNLNVNVYEGQKHVVNEEDNTIYIWDGRKYVPSKQELLASAIKGIIQPNQLAAIPTGKLSGQITSDQIQELQATKVVGTLNIAQIPNVPTNKLTGVLTDAQVQSLSAVKLIGTVPVERVPNIPTTKLTGSVTDEQIATLNASKLTGTLGVERLPSVPTTKLTGKITDAQLSQVSASKISGTIDLSKIPDVPTTKLTGTVLAHQIAANAIGANHIGANAVTAEKLDAGAVNARAISANAINGTHINANAIGANHITAGAITASKMVMYGENMILDPMFADPAYWRETMLRFATVENGVLTYILNNTATVNNGAYIAGLRNAKDMPIDEDRSYRLQCRVSIEGNINSDCEASAHVIGYETLNPNGAGGGAFKVFGKKQVGNGEQLLTVVVPSELLKANGCKFIGIYLRIGRTSAGAVSAATVKFSNIELIKMADADLIVDGAISAAKIQADAITADKVQAGAITSGKIAANAVTADNIQANAITAAKIGANAVTADKILAGSVTAVKIATNAVTADKINANAVTADKIQANAVVAGKVATDAIQANNIQAGAIVAGKLAVDAVLSNNIKSMAITAEKMSVNSVGTNALQANAVVADKIQAGAITTAKIQANAINAQHIAAGQISADKLAIGLGGNLLVNPIFANPTDGVPFGWTLRDQIASENRIVRSATQENKYGWKAGGYLLNENVVRIGNRQDIDGKRTMLMQEVPVIAGQWYMASAYMGNHRSKNVEIVLNYMDGTQFIKSYRKSCDPSKNFAGAANADRVFIKSQAPENAVSVQVYFVLHNRIDETSANSTYMFVARPMLEECTEYTQEPSSWQNAGVTSIHGGSIVTRSITAEQIGVGQITTEHMTAGSIDANRIRAGSVTAQQLAAHSVTADKMWVESLSVVSSNIGHITAGTITGTTINGNTITGGTISGTTISGGVIKGTRLEGATGKFTGEVEITQLIGGNVIEMVYVPLKKLRQREERRFHVRTERNSRDDTEREVREYYNVTIITYGRTVSISSAPTGRYIECATHAPFILPAGESRALSVEIESESKQAPTILVKAYAVSTSKSISFA